MTLPVRGSSWRESSVNCDCGTLKRVDSSIDVIACDSNFLTDGQAWVCAGER